MTQVFMSYSHQDSVYAHRLADEMKQRGIEVWIDDRINYGDQWPKVIQENLEGCKLVVVIMSSNSFNSKWVHNELAFAQDSGKVILPLLLEGKLWVSLASTQHADVKGGRLPPENFYNIVKQHLGYGQDAASPRTPGKQPTSSPREESRLAGEIVQTLRAAIKGKRNASWEMGLFKATFYFYSTAAGSYWFYTEFDNEHLLGQYDLPALSNYKVSHEAIVKKAKTKYPLGSRFAITAGTLTSDWDNYLRPKHELELRLKLRLETSFKSEPTDAQIQEIAAGMIQLHKDHRIPISKIRIKSLK
jgi:hypothetical protein